MWNKYPETSPDLYSVLGVQVSKPMFIANVLTRTNGVASMWVTQDKEVWREYTSGTEIYITHWQEITQPKD